MTSPSSNEVEFFGSPEPEGASDPSVPGGSQGVSRSVFFFCLIAMLIVQGALWWDIADGDPFSAGGSAETERQLEDYWYMAEARSMYLGQPISSPDEYRRPALTALYSLAFRAAGLSRMTVHSVAGVALLLATLLTVMGFARRVGRRPAVVAGWLLALQPVWNAASVTAHPSHVASVVILASLLIGSGVRQWRLVAGFTLSLFGALFLHEAVGLASVALLIEGWRRTLRGRESTATGRSTWAFPAGAALFVGVGLFLLLAPHSSLTTIPWASLANGKIIESFPVLTLLGVVSLFMWATTTSRSPDPFDRVSATVLTLGFFWASLQQAGTVQCFLILIPLLAYQAALLFERSLRHGESSALQWSAPLAIGLSLCVGFSLWIFGKSWTEQLARLAKQDEVPWSGVVTLVVVSMALSAPLWRRLSGSPWAPSLGAVLLLVVWGGGWAVRLGHVEMTHAQASGQLPALILPNAVISGPAAAALALGSELAITYGVVSPGQLPFQTAVGVSSTHWCRFEGREWATVGEDPDQRLGRTSLERTDSFRIDTIEVELFRFDRALGPRSAFEEAVHRLRSRELVQAEEMLSLVLTSWPDSGAAWAQLGHCLQRAERPRGAYLSYQRAILAEPQRLTAQFELARLYLSENAPRQALFHLRVAAKHVPEDPKLAQKIGRIERSLGKVPR